MTDRRYPKKRRKRITAGKRQDKRIIKAISAILYLICAVLFVIYAAMLLFRFFIGSDPGGLFTGKTAGSSFVSEINEDEMQKGHVKYEGPASEIINGARGSYKAYESFGQGELYGGFEQGKVYDSFGTEKIYGGYGTGDIYEGAFGNDLSGHEAFADRSSGENIQRLREEPRLKDARLLFGGNVYLSSYVLSAYDDEGIGGVLSPAIMDLSRKADLFMANQVFPFSERGEAEAGKEYAYRVSPERVNILKAAGIDCVALANNHVLDYGYDALSDTIDTLDRAKIAHVGAGENYDEASRAVIMDINGMRTAVVSSSRRVPDASWGAGKNRAGVFLSYDANKENYLNYISELNRSCDFVISYIYWGRNDGDTQIPDYMKILTRESVDAGADLVICTAFDSAEGIEYYNDVPIVYSLGDMMYGSSTDKGYLLELETKEAGNEMKLKLYSLSSQMGYTKITDMSETEQ